MAQQRAEPYAQFPLQGHRCASEVMGVSYDIMYWYLCNTMSPRHAILIFLSKIRHNYAENLKAIVPKVGWYSKDISYDTGTLFKNIQTVEHKMIDRADSNFLGANERFASK